MSKVLDDVSILTGEVEKLKRENKALKQALYKATTPDYATIAKNAWRDEPSVEHDMKWRAAVAAIIIAYKKHEASL